MDNLFKLGRIFYGVAVVQTGLQIIYYHDFPYWLIPPKHSGIPGLALLAYVSGILLLLVGASILLQKKAKSLCLISGGVFLLIFFFYFIPYQFIAGKYSALVEWENAFKELSFASGMFVIAGMSSETSENRLVRFLGKLEPYGPIMYAIPIFTFGIVHYQFPKEVAALIPTWIPIPLYLGYFAGTCLLGSGVAILFKIRVRLIAGLLGLMIGIWFFILHIPRLFDAQPAYLPGEVTSAFIALAYSGIAFLIASSATKKS